MIKKWSFYINSTFSLVYWLIFFKEAPSGLEFNRMPSTNFLFVITFDCHKKPPISQYAKPRSTYPELLKIVLIIFSLLVKIRHLFIFHMNYY